MNKDIVEGKWKQMRGEAKAWWGKLTDDDLDRAAGKFEVLAGILQEKYGYTTLIETGTYLGNGMKEKVKPNLV